MAGIYLHIPYCKKACHYCDFHFSTNISNRKNLVEALVKEIELQREFLGNEPIETIYFGGGTPSLLSFEELDHIFNSIHKHHQISEKPEITLEANPDDISVEKLRTFKKLGINRLSIGLQTFHEPFLQWMNRAHTAEESYNSVKMAQDEGFNNISIDLIYGIPHTNHEVWQNDLEKAISLQTPHISAYFLTIEEKTAFGKWKKTGKLTEATDDFAATQFEMLLSALEANQFIQYEISNFGKENFFSGHNSNYWKGVKYLGIGPAAHSFDGVNRQANIANNQLYINSLEKNIIPAEKEILTEKDKANDYLLTSLRTMWGTDISKFENLEKEKIIAFLKKVNTQQTIGNLLITNNVITLTQKGKFLADAISSELFFE